jgi:hypothetical protein
VVGISGTVTSIEPIEETLIEGGKLVFWVGSRSIKRDGVDPDCIVIICNSTYDQHENSTRLRARNDLQAP